MMAEFSYNIPAELQDHINEQGFARISTSMKERFTTVLDDYLEETGALLHELVTALEQSEHTEAARHAQLIKAESRSFGLTSLAEVAEAIEEMADVAGDAAFSNHELLLLAEQLEENFSVVEPYLREVTESRG